MTSKFSSLFNKFFYSNVPIGVSKRNWRSNRLLPTSWNQKNQRREEAGEPNQRLRFSWPGKPRPMQQQTYSPLDGKTLRKSLLFSDFWCITDLFCENGFKNVGIKWSKIDYNFDTCGFWPSAKEYKKSFEVFWSQLSFYFWLENSKWKYLNFWSIFEKNSQITLIKLMFDRDLKKIRFQIEMVGSIWLTNDLALNLKGCYAFLEKRPRKSEL